MAKKKGRPRWKGTIKKCPRCGKMGWPVKQQHRRVTKEGTKVYTYLVFRHYDPSKSSLKRVCQIKKPKTK